MRKKMKTVVVNKPKKPKLRVDLFRFFKTNLREIYESKDYVSWAEWAIKYFELEFGRDIKSHLWFDSNYPPVRYYVSKSVARKISEYYNLPQESWIYM